MFSFLTPKMLPQNKLILSTIIIIVVQTCCATYGLSLGSGYGIMSILFFVSSIALALVVLNSNSLQLHISTKAFTYNKPTLLILVVLIVGSFICCKLLFAANPIAKESADMLPIIKVMCNRFVSGAVSKVYTPIPEIWGGIQPIYLPTMWLPYTVTEVLHIDMRWVTFACIWCIVLLCYATVNSTTLYRKYVVFATLLVVLVWLHYNKVNNVLRLTEEGVVYLYYTLLVMAVVSRNAVYIGITLSLCLLSRYSVIGCVPALYLYWLITKAYSTMLTVTAIVSGSVLLGFILPFGTTTCLTLLQQPNAYISHAQRIWEESPQFFTESLGFAKFFGKANILLQHKLLIVGSFVLPTLFVISSYTYQYITKKKLNNIPLATLLIGIAYFYSMLDVSYLYLYYTALFISISTVSILFANRTVVCNTI